MKKMMMALAVALLAIGAQAGAANWSVLNINTPVSGLNSGADLSGAMAYLFVGAVPATIADVKTAVQTKAFAGWETVKGPSTAAGAVASSTYGTYVSQVVSLYVVVFDTGLKTGDGQTGNFLISSAITKTFGSTGNQTYTFSLTTVNTWTGYTVVPEPTSMALLALGAAAVGLRRKFRK